MRVPRDITPIALLAIALMPLRARAQDTPATDPGPPRLVVLIVIDQFRADYLERFGAWYGPRGLPRLEREGAVFTNARYRHSTTETGPGHATIATGGHACAHGIVGNHWFDRARGRTVYCMEDTSATALIAPRGPVAGSEARPADASAHMADLVAGRPRGGTSPRNLRSSTFADELRIARGEGSRIVACSIKDRAAILLGGRLGKAFWWDQAGGRFTTSTFYAKALPAWAEAFNASRPAEKYRGRSWDRILPEAAYAPLGPDDCPWEKDLGGLGRVFPHPLPGAGASALELDRALVSTPLGNELLLDFARSALRGEGLGKRAGATDVLAVSLSSNDYVGHAFGPDSHEVMDACVRTDRQIADFLSFLDSEVGLERTIVALTSDHGVAMAPELAVERGFPAGRLDPQDLALRAGRVVRPYARAGAAGTITAFVTPNLYIDWKDFPEKARAPRERALIEAEAAAAMREAPGIAYAFTRSDLLRGIVPATPIGRAVALAFDAERSGDVVVVAAPYWYLDQDPFDDCATHGTPWSYDAHVPLILRGRGIRAGVYERACSPADLAPTLARVLETETPSGCDGEPLFEALETARGTAVLR